MDWVGAGRRLVEIELQAGLKMYSAAELNSVIISDKGLASKQRLLIKAKKNLALLEKFAFDHDLTGATLQVCRSLYRQTKEVQGNATRQIERIERVLKRMRGEEQVRGL